MRACVLVWGSVLKSIVSQVCVVIAVCVFFALNGSTGAANRFFYPMTSSKPIVRADSSS